MSAVELDTSAPATASLSCLPAPSQNWVLGTPGGTIAISSSRVFGSISTMCRWGAPVWS